MEKGKKGPGYEEAVNKLQMELDSRFKTICKALGEKTPSIESHSIEEVVKSLIRNPRIIHMELVKASGAYGQLEFIKANVGEKDEQQISFS